MKKVKIRKTKVIRIHLTEGQYQDIRKKSTEKSMPMSKYIKRTFIEF
jgi:hypothetical protein